jgi:hypothetical protein
VLSGLDPNDPGVVDVPDTSAVEAGDGLLERLVVLEGVDELQLSLLVLELDRPPMSLSMTGWSFPLTRA